MKTIIITGAANGVGSSVAKLLKENRLILLDNDEVQLKDTAEKVGAEYHVCDVADDKSVSKVMSLITKNHDVIDVLINCAGMWIAGDMSQLSETPFKEMNELSRIKKVIDTNLFGIIAMTTQVSPIMIKQGFGQIVNINSQSGVKTETPYPIYNASKTGVTAFRKAIQDDLAKANVKITDICPGLISTGFYDRANNPLPDFVLDLGLSAYEVADAVKYVLELPDHISIPSMELMNMKSF